MSSRPRSATWFVVLALSVMFGAAVAACARSAMPDDDAALAEYRRVAEQEPRSLHIDGAPTLRRWSFGEPPAEGGAVPAPRVAWHGRERPEWTPQAPVYDGSDVAIAGEGSGLVVNPVSSSELVDGTADGPRDTEVPGTGADDQDVFVITSPSPPRTSTRRAARPPIAGLQCVAQELLRSTAPYPVDAPLSLALIDQAAAACGSGLYPRYRFAETYSGHEATAPPWAALNGRAEATCREGNPYGAAWMDHPAGPRSMIVCDTPLMQLGALQRTGVRDGFEVRATPTDRLRDARVRVEQGGRMTRCERELLLDDGALVWSCPFDEELISGNVVLEARPFRPGWYERVGVVTVTAAEELPPGFELPEPSATSDGSLEPVLVDEANALRAAAGLPALTVAASQQELNALAHRRVYDEDVSDDDRRTLLRGLSSSWQMPGEMPRVLFWRVSFAGADTAEVVSSILAAPTARAILLDDQMTHIVVSQVSTDEATSVWLTLYGSRPTEQEQASALLDEVVARRAALGRRTTLLSETEQLYIEGRAEAITSRNLSPSRARDDMRQRIPRMGEGVVWIDLWGYVEDIEDCLIPEDVLAPDDIAISLAIGTYRGPDDVHSGRYALVAWRER